MRYTFFNSFLIVAFAVLAFTFTKLESIPAEPELTELFRGRFADPPSAFRIVQYGKPTAAQLEQWKPFGVGGAMAFFHNEMRDPASDHYEDIKRIPEILEHARAAGVRVWLADDFGYPSGMAGGKVVEENPEYEVRGLVRLVASGRGTDASALIQLPDDLERAVHAVIYPVVDAQPDYTQGRALAFTGRSVETPGLAGDWQLEVFALKVINEESQAQSTVGEFHHKGRYPDLLNPDAVESFLRHFHSRIESEVGDLSGLVEGFYTNEPNLMRMHFGWYIPDRRTGKYAMIPWNERLPGVFQRMHGYSVMPRLGALFAGQAPEDRRVRVHYQMTVAEMLTQSFGRQVADWCAARGIRSGGHFLLNEYLSMHVSGYGDLMKLVAEFHVPGLDIGIPEPGRIADFPFQQTKFFSSVAAWKEREEVICLPDPIIAVGSRDRLSPDIPLVRNTVNMAFLHGANVITSYLFLLPVAEGYHTGSGYKPEAFTHLGEYVGRLSLLLRGARRDTPVALLYPIRMFQADYLPSKMLYPDVVALHAVRHKSWEDTELALLDAGLDYEIVHPEALAQAKVEAGEIHIGWGRYRHLVMPQVEVLSREALAVIQRFEAGGGAVHWVDSVPDMAIYNRDDALLQEALADVVPIARTELASYISMGHEPLLAPAALTDDEQSVSVARFTKDGRRIALFVNRSLDSVTVPLALPGPVTLLYPATGIIEAQVTPQSVDIEGASSLVIWY